MEKIASFQVNHLDLLTGIYVSRKDDVNGNILTTFDLRFTRPNVEPVMDTAGIHAIEHLAATYLRNEPEWKNKIIYFGPMGCRTGFYLILAGNYTPHDIFGLIKKMCCFILDFEGNIPGASARDCGNYLDMNLTFAKCYVRKYLEEVLAEEDEKRMNYPE